MHLEPKLIPDWPRLAWLARLRKGSDAIQVLHGPCVETTHAWCFEGAWTGDFTAADFDREDVVMGSGIRCRSDYAVFVSPNTAMDRVFCCCRDDARFVSNSFAALSAVADVSLREDFQYANDRHGVVRTTWGLDSCFRTIPADPVDVSFFWANNMVFDGHSLHEEVKPERSAAFKTYGEYRDFMFQSAEALGENMRSSGRAHRVGSLVSVSSGYDSPAAAVIAKRAGCEEAVTFKQSRSLWRGSDSGAEIARLLELKCRTYPLSAKDFPHEEAVWAACGYANLLNWTLFEFSPPMTVLFVGNYGDAVWSRRRSPKPFLLNLWDDLGMGEYRLMSGIVLCPVAFWGMRRIDDIRRITFSEEMAPWTLNTGYDRPIPRRMIEESGVPRGMFAVRKKNTSHETVFKWPLSCDARERFARFLRKRGLFAPPPWMINAIAAAAYVDGLIFRNVVRKLGIRKGQRQWQPLRGASLVFHWANEEMKRLYRQSMDASDRTPGRNDAPDAGTAEFMPACSGGAIEP